MQTLMLCCTTVCQSIHLGVSIIQRVRTTLDEPCVPIEENVSLYQLPMYQRHKVKLWMVGLVKEVQ